MSPDAQLALAFLIIAAALVGSLVLDWIDDARMRRAQLEARRRAARRARL